MFVLLLLSNIYLSLVVVLVVVVVGIMIALDEGSCGGGSWLWRKSSISKYVSRTETYS